ncbi:hypothetical protein [Magnetospirillum moscoviense]|uniref:hypothetical protein n=1 Tax=Magnetospirillum moscoviense TaxID=1437059 RepID=UPI000B14C7A0|nr:hypothetical protein [Magnetospirillum moscoviense]
MYEKIAKGLRKEFFRKIEDMSGGKMAGILSMIKSIYSHRLGDKAFERECDKIISRLKSEFFVASVVIKKFGFASKRNVAVFITMTKDDDGPHGGSVIKFNANNFIMKKSNFTWIDHGTPIMISEHAIYRMFNRSEIYNDHRDIISKIDEILIKSIMLIPFVENFEIFNLPVMCPIEGGVLLGLTVPFNLKTTDGCVKIQNGTAEFFDSKNTLKTSVLSSVGRENNDFEFGINYRTFISGNEVSEGQSEICRNINSVFLKYEKVVIKVATSILFQSDDGLIMNFTDQEISDANLFADDMRQIINNVDTWRKTHAPNGVGIYTIDDIYDSM